MVLKQLVLIQQYPVLVSDTIRHIQSILVANTILILCKGRARCEHTDRPSGRERRCNREQSQNRSPVWCSHSA